MSPSVNHLKVWFREQRQLVDEYSKVKSKKLLQNSLDSFLIVVDIFRRNSSGRLLMYELITKSIIVVDLSKGRFA